MAGLRDLFEIRTGEWNRFILLYIFVFMVTVAVIWGGAASDSFFLTIVGPQFLPYLFIINAFLTIITITIYSAFVDRLSNTFLMIAIAVLGALGLLIARFALDIPNFTPVYWALYLLSRVLKDVISIHAWTYIADFYDTRTAKRHFPLLGSASRTAGIVGGALIGPITALFQANGLVMAWAGALSISGVLAFTTPRLVQLVTDTERSEEAPSGFIQNVQAGFGVVASSGFLRFMAGAALVGTILLKVLEFQTQTVFAAEFTTTERLATLLGQLQVVGNLLTLPIQMFFLSRLVAKVGVGNANLIFPGSSALAYGLLLVFGSLPAAIFGYINYEMLRSAFRTPIDGLMYNAVPPAVKGRARAFINGILIPLGLMAAGVMLLANTAGLLSLRVLTVLGIITAVGYIATALGARAQYGRSLATLLGDEMSIFRLSPTDQADPATLKLLHWRLEESEDDDMTIFLLQILHDFEGSDAIPRLLRFATGHSTTVRAGATRILADEVTEPEVRQLCLDGLKHPEAMVRAASAEALASAQDAERDEELLTALLEMLEDADDTVRARVIPPLIASGDFFYLAPAVEVLSGWLRDEANVQNRGLGLRVLTQTGSERLLRTLVRYLDDPSPLVRRQAVELIDDLAAETPLAEVKQLGRDTLASLLQDDDESVRIAAVHGLGHFSSLSSSRALLTSLSDPSFEVRRHACNAIHPVPKRELLEALERSHDYYLVECASFVLSRDGNSRARRQVLELMDALITNAYRLRAQQLALEPYNTVGAEMLKTTLGEQAEDFVKRAFWLLGSLTDEEDEATTILHSLRSDVVSTRANATETLEATTSPHLARLVAPLYEEMPLADLVKQGQDVLSFEMPTAWQVFQLAWPQFEIDANPWDLSALPAPQRRIMRIMLRDVELTAEELAAAVRELPEDKRLAPSEIGEAVRALTAESWLLSEGEGRATTFRINLHRKPGGAFAQTIWATLTDRNLADFYTGEGWLTAVTIYALLELSEQAGDGGEAALSADTLRRALQTTLQDKDIPAVVEETARLGLTLANGNGHDAAEKSMLTTIEKVIFLKQVPFFQTMTIDQLRIFASISEEVTIEEGERIITEGDRGDTLYVIVNGQVSIERRTERQSGDEDVTRLAALGSYEYFAEMSVFDNQPYSADARAIQRSVLLLIRQTPLVTLIQNQPDLALGLLKVLSVRLRQANEIIAERSKTRPKQVMDLLDSLE